MLKATALVCSRVAYEIQILLCHHHRLTPDPHQTDPPGIPSYT